MAAKVEKKTKATKQTQPKDLKTILVRLEVIEGLVRNVLEAQAATPISIVAEVKKEEKGGGEEVAKQHIINQEGEALELTYEVVMEEANKLVSIDQFGEKRGFGEAKKIILSYGVAKLEDVPKEYYSEIIANFRGAVKAWK